MMQQEATLRYADTDGYQAVDLLYGNGAFAMTVILPRPGSEPGEVLAGLDPTAWRDLAARFHDATVVLTLPRFRLDHSRRLDPDLAALGMAIAFDPARADFYRIADVRPERLFISRVEQKTFLEVNEEGTEAAAATGVGIGVTSAPQVVHLVVNRPFLFAIREPRTGTVVFLGLINALGE
jgi:serpin B